MYIRLQARGFFKKTILKYVATMLNTELNVNDVVITVSVRFKEIEDVKEFPV